MSEKVVVIIISSTEQKNACPSLLNYLPKLLPSSSLHSVGTVRTCNHFYTYEKALLNILILFFQ